MVKQKETKPSQVVIFVEGDTDEILFKALIEYYRIVEQLDEGVVLRVFPDNVSGMVSTPAVDEEHFQLVLRVVLLQNRLNAPFNELLFIE
jgi:hypothetical protein